MGALRGAHPRAPARSGGKEALAGRADFVSGVGATPSEISAAAETLGRLAESYLSFVRDFGWGMLGPQDIFGLGPDVPQYLDVVRVALNEWATGGMSTHLVPIHGTGSGDYACLIAGETGSVDERVVYWAHDDRDAEPYVLAGTFPDWLMDMMRRTSG